MTQNPWEKQPGEPTRWYALFAKYYLADGVARSVYRAYAKFAKDSGPEVFAQFRARGVPQKWYVMADRWNWETRCQAHDMYTSQLALQTVTEADVRIKLLAVQAVKALELSLISEKFRVAAAKEILDRAGLPALSRQEVVSRVSITSDDMNAALKEVDEWEREKTKSSG